MSKHLVTFLLKYMDEDVEAARNSPAPEWEVAPDNRHHVQVVPADDAIGPSAVIAYIVGGEGEHIARHDPARVLRSIPARRRIVEAYAEALRIQDGFKETGAEESARETLESVCRAYAADYADKPDYREEWTIQ